MDPVTDHLYLCLTFYQNDDVQDYHINFCIYRDKIKTVSKILANRSFSLAQVIWDKCCKYVVKYAVVLRDNMHGISIDYHENIDLMMCIMANIHSLYGSFPTLLNVFPILK